MAHDLRDQAPSTSRPTLFRHRLERLLARRLGRIRSRCIAPKLMPGLSFLTLSRCSLAKNMYAERPRLGALGSVDRLALVDSVVIAAQLTLLLLALADRLGLGLAGGLFLGHYDALRRHGQMTRRYWEKTRRKAWWRGKARCKERRAA